MAEGLAHLLGGDRVEAHSAGSRPSGVVNPRAIEIMAELGYDLSAHRSTAIDDIPAGPFDAVITMGCGDACPHVPASRREDWDIADPKDMPLEGFREVRDDIRTRVARLLAELAPAAS
jgi:arsenate reductase